MGVKGNMQGLSELCRGKDKLPKEVLEWIALENLWNLWVPKYYGGLELSLVEGLVKLQSLARIDGSLGWTVTLCSGANFFVGNLQKEVADEIFLNAEKPIFGGSGGVFGTAERKGEGYIISGVWRYATGAPYITHFTLNATIMDRGRKVLVEDGTPVIRSFVVDRKDVQIIRDWNTMGLRATATDSFGVESKWVHEKYSFVYNELHQHHPIFKVPFSAFADLTLWVNYIGMAQHFLEEAQNILGPHVSLYRLLGMITKSEYSVMEYGRKIERLIADDGQVSDRYIREIHQEASESVKLLSEAIIGAYPSLGIKATSMGHPLNQVFRDYFTATQHHIFRSAVEETCDEQL